MSKTKVIRILKNNSIYDNQEALEMLKERHTELQCTLLRDCRILCYSDSTSHFSAPMFELQTKIEFEKLESLNFLSEEIKEKVLSFISIPVCPDCSASLIDHPVELRAYASHRFNPVTEKFELDSIMIDSAENFCSNCWNEITLQEHIPAQEITFEKNESNELQMKKYKVIR